MSDQATTELKLRQASVEHDGERFIRASVAARIIGIGPGMQTRWIKDGHVVPRRFQVPRGRKAPRGIVTAWPLNQTIERARAYRPQSERSWSEQEIDELAESIGTLRIEKIAQRLGRSVGAVRDKMMELGINQRNAQGFMTTGQIAKLCGVSREAVQQWCLRSSPPLKFRRSPAQDRVKLIDPEDLVAFLRQHPAILNKKSWTIQRRIERRLKPLHERRKAVSL